MALIRVTSLVALLVALASAQVPQPKLSFEVASVRISGPSTPGLAAVNIVQGGPGTGEPERFRATRTTLGYLVRIAYGVELDQISGPGWLADEHYDVAANIPPGTTRQQMNEMLQSLLAERYRLALHHETRELPAWNLSVTRGGPKLTQTLYPEALPGRPGEDPFGNDKAGFPQLPPNRSGSRGQVIDGVMRVTYQAFSIANLIESLSYRLGAIPGASFAPARIVDKTGLTGKYDFHLSYRAGTGLPGDSTKALDTDAGGFTTGPGASDLISALEKQAGLKLEESKAKVDIFVIDHAERTPVEN